MEETQARVIAGRYRVVRPLGRGGMGEVFLVEDLLPPRRRLALKRIPLAGDGRARAAALEREFRTLRTLRHPHIATVDAFGWIRDGEQPAAAFFTSEFVEGSDLFEASRGLALAELWPLLAQLVAALEYVHARGIVHRDVKPSNVVVASGEDGTVVKLIDFGLAVRAARGAAEAPAGTVRYMAPEVIESGVVDPRADLYALGVTLYELLTGQPPFGGTAKEILRQHLERRLRPPSELRPELPPVVDRLVLSLCAKDPRERPRSARQVLEAIARLSPAARAVARQSALSGELLIGRERECETVLRWLERRFGQRCSDDAAVPKLLGVLGDVGTGKTELLRECKHHAQLLGATVLEVVCEPGGRAYAPMARLLEAVTCLSGGERNEAAAGMAELARLLGRSAGDSEGGGESAQPAGWIDVERERTRLFEAVRAVLCAAAERRPLLCVLHDLHRGDAGTLALLRHLVRAREGAPVAFACSARTGGALADWFEQLEASGALERVSLGPLDRASSLALVRAMWPGGRLRPGVAERIYEHTGGNPYFIRETVRSLLERSEGGEDAPVGAAAIETTQVPQSVAEVLRNRIALLGAGERAVLEVLAAARLPLSEREIEQLLGPGGAGCGQLLAALCERGMAVREPGGAGAPRYRCVHELLREVVLRCMESGARTALHARLAAWLEQRPDADPAVLVEHLREAGLSARGFRYAVAAGDDARALYANERAIRHYRQALAWAQAAGATGRERAGVFESLGLVCQRTGDLRGAERCFRQALTLLRREPAPPAETIARVCRRLGECFEAAGNFDAALEALSDGIRALGVDLASAEAARLLGATALVYIRAGRYDEALEFVDAGLRWADEQAAAERAALYNAGGVALLCRGEPRQAAERFQRSLEIRRRLGDEPAVAQSLNNLGAAFVEEGHFGRAVIYFEEAMRRSVAVGDVRAAAETAAHLGDVRLRLGEIERALELFERSVKLAGRVDDPDGWLLALQRLTRLEIELGQLDDAAQHIAQAERVVERLRRAEARGGRADAPRWPTRACVRAALVRARFLAVVGRLEPARELRESLLESGGRQRAPGERAEAFKLLGRVLVDLGRLEDAERAINEAQTLYGQLGNEHDAIRVTIDRIDLMARRGEHELARMAFAGLEQRLQQRRAARLLGPAKWVEGRLLAAAAPADDPQAVGAALLVIEQARKLLRADRRPELLWRLEASAAAVCERSGAFERGLRAAIRGMDVLRAVVDRTPPAWRESYLAHPGRVALRACFRRLRERVAER